MKTETSPLPIISWAIYDLANQFFAVLIVSLYFPLWIKEQGYPEILYSLSFGVSMFFVAVLAPILGTIADMERRHKALLVYFTLLSVIFTMALGFSANVFLALVFFAVANFGCQEAIIFYNSLLIKIAPEGRTGLVSGVGRMFGYSGAVLALYIAKSTIIDMGYQATFFIAGVLFLIFSLPCMVFVKEKSSEEKANSIHFPDKKKQIYEIFGKLRTAVFDGYGSGSLRNFLKASFFGLCAVNTVILFMSIYATKVFGLTMAEITDLIIFSTLFAIVGSIISGYVGDIIGYRRSLIGVFFLWAICLTGGSLVYKPFHWLLGASMGFSLGATWVIARAFVIKLAPKEKLGETFGLFNLVSYAAGIVGPLTWGVVLLYLSRYGSEGYRLAFLGFVPFIGVGIIYLLRMKIERGDVS